MCVGLSAKVVRINEGMAVVDADGAKREVSAELLDELEPGDYVMVHAGVAIAKITDEDESEISSWRIYYNGRKKENSQRDHRRL